MPSDPKHIVFVRNDTRSVTTLIQSEGRKMLKAAHDPEAATRVIILDRDSMSSDLLASAITEHCSFQALAVNSAQLFNVMAKSTPNVLVIGAELDLGSGSGFDLAQRVHRSYPNVHIVLLLSQTDQESILSAFRCGARGVFSRQEPMAEFLHCIVHVSNGGLWGGKGEATALLDAFKNMPAPRVFNATNMPSLTARELQVVKWAAKGKTNKSIASELGLSEHTVKNYLFRAFEKIGVSSRIELLFYLTLQGHTFSPHTRETAPEDVSA